jgi:UDP-glucose 4-epimerase
VVGASGLLGQHVSALVRARGRLFAGPAVPWQTDAAAPALRRGAEELLAAAGGGPWQVVWAAGAGVTSASAQALAQELEVLGAALASIAVSTVGAERNGAFFFASSAGGVYAGVPGPPHDETSAVHALSPYGEAKLEAEALVAAWSRSCGIASLSGRIANLYGPGQNLAKAQGLISQICWADLLGRPLSIYVPLDTIRDYLYAPDAAGLVLDSLDALRAEAAAQPAGSGPARVKVLASGRAVSIAQVIGVLRLIVRHSPRLVLASRPAARHQALNLALRSVVYPEVDRRALTPLPVGMAATRADLALQLGASGAPV